MDSTIVLYAVGLVALILLLWLFSQQSGKLKLAELREAVAVLVDAAEQMMPGATGSEKLSFVLSRADELGLTKCIHPTLLRAMIESSVLWLKRGA